jgi:hypothetical protein
VTSTQAHLFCEIDLCLDNDGTRNRATVEAREVANRMVDDPVYRESLRQRLIDGTVGAISRCCGSLRTDGQPSVSSSR